MIAQVWNPNTYDSERRRLVPCFDDFYGTVAAMVARFCPPSPRLLDLGAGTGILSGAIIERVKTARVCLLDGSSEMVARAEARLAALRPEVWVQPLEAELPEGPFDAVVSALAIHHLTDAAKQSLYARILKVLAPGGLFLNAEQVSGRNERLERLFKSVQLDRNRELGSSPAEIEGAIQRMGSDRCATAADQVAWLQTAGFQDADCFYQWFGFAVFGGWAPSTGRQ